MIKQYGVYNYHETNSTLLILFDEQKHNLKKKVGEVDILYHDDKIVGYEIANFIRYAKIKYSGIIFLPTNPLIDIINSVLRKYDLELLGYKSSSGYITKMNGSELCVYAIEGTYLRDHSISKGKFCSYYDLDIKCEDDQKVFVIDENIQPGLDFFSAEVR